MLQRKLYKVNLQSSLLIIWYGQRLSRRVILLPSHPTEQLAIQLGGQNRLLVRQSSINQS